MKTVQDLETPFLAAELEALDANIALMRDTILGAGVRWRPHVKAIRSPALAHRLVAAGASGVSCATLGEAEIMVAAGISDVLIANQVVQRPALERLARLSKTAAAAVAIDDVGNAAALSAAAAAAGTRISVLIEVEIGLGRAGVAPRRPVVALAQSVSALPGLDLKGVMGWEGHATAITDPEAKAAAVAEAVAKLVDSAAAARAAGVPMSVVSCGGTGTYAIAARCFGVTEIQAGGGIFGDLRYRHEFGVPHACALMVWSTVTSRPGPRRIVVDAGFKSMAAYPTPPRPIGLGPVERLRLAAEHATLDLAEPATRPALGDRLAFEVGYSDSTVFLHDAIHAVRGEILEAVWPLPRRMAMGNR